MVSAKGDKKEMSESDEEGVVSTKRSYGPGEDIFGKYDPDNLVEDGPADNSTDEDEEDTEDEEEDEEDDEEEKMKRKKTKKKRMFLKRRKSIKFDHGMS